MLARVWGLVLLYVGLAACTASTGGGDEPPTGGGFGGFGALSTDGGGIGGTIPTGTGGGTQGGFGGFSVGGSSGIPQGGTSGVAGAGNAPSTGGAPPVNMCGTVFKDCNGNTADGCETNTTDDAANCGACGVVCPPGPNASPTCFVSKCSFACQANWGDCDGDPANGCEDNLLTDANNCGSCNFKCDGGKPCQQGGCECASQSQKGEKVPVDIYVLFDQSGSMNDNVTGGTKWDVIVGALTSFLNNSASAGIGVGIGYFPIPDKTLPFLDDCIVPDYATPSVPIAPLPGVASSITSSLASHGPAGTTPTYAAIQGAMQYVVSYQKANPTRKTVLVLATDGDPNTCNSNPQNVASVAAAGLTPTNGDPSILTFVIGVGSSLTSLNGVAAAGGTNQAFIVDTAGADPGGQFLKAMQDIQTSVLIGCQYAVPTPTGGATFDKDKVNVQYTPTGSTPISLGRVTDVNACTPSAGGWYYDDPAAPKQIILCSSSCTAINTGATATVEIVLGCATHG